MRTATLALLGALTFGVLPAAAQTVACTPQGTNSMICEARVTLAVAAPVEIRLGVQRTPSGTTFMSQHAAAEFGDCSAAQVRGAPHTIMLNQAPQMVSLTQGNMAAGSYCARVQIMACRRNGANASCQQGFLASVMVVLVR